MNSADTFQQVFLFPKQRECVAAEWKHGGHHPLLSFSLVLGSAF